MSDYAFQGHLLNLTKWLDGQIGVLEARFERVQGDLIAIEDQLIEKRQAVERLSLYSAEYAKEPVCLHCWLQGRHAPLILATMENVEPVFTCPQCGNESSGLEFQAAS